MFFISGYECVKNEPEMNIFFLNGRPTFFIVKF